MICSVQVSRVAERDCRLVADPKGQRPQLKTWRNSAAQVELVAPGMPQSYIL